MHALDLQERHRYSHLQSETTYKSALLNSKSVLPRLILTKSSLSTNTTEQGCFQGPYTKYEH